MFNASKGSAGVTVSENSAFYHGNKLQGLSNRWIMINRIQIIYTLYVHLIYTEHMHILCKQTFYFVFDSPN